jgi:hypothetical protein
MTESYRLMASLNLPCERRLFARSRWAAGSVAPAPEAATPPNRMDDAALATRRNGVRRMNMAEEEGGGMTVGEWEGVKGGGRVDGGEGARVQGGDGCGPRESRRQRVNT